MRKATDPITDELVRGSKIAWAAELRAERAEREAGRLRTEMEAVNDLLCDGFVGQAAVRLGAALDDHPTPQAGEGEP